MQVRLLTVTLSYKATKSTEGLQEVRDAHSSVDGADNITAQ
ncbi:MAG: hypothetical protein PHH31_09475 [Acidaminococcaceae bacterium]|nr:hypothetical protein [Acidaminococcaceae bacterium]